MGVSNDDRFPRRRPLRRFLRAVAALVLILAISLVGFVLLGGREWLVREQLETVFAGRVDAPQMDAGFGIVRLRNGRLWEEGHPDHCQILAPEAEGEIDLANLWCPRVRIRGGVLSYRERIDAAFVKPITARFPVIELEDTTVLLAGETVLHAERAELSRDADRVYRFTGSGITHHGVRLDEVALRLTEHGAGVDVPGAVVRLLGGTATASVVVGEGGKFAGHGRARDIDIATSLDALGPPGDLKVEGRADIEFSVTGRADDLASARAEGRVVIRDLHSGDEPGLQDLLGVLLGADPDAGPFTSGQGSLELGDGRVRIRDGEILGPRWGLRANGVVDILRREVDIEVVLFDRRRRLETLPVIGPVLQALADTLRERLVRARIQGPFDRVRIVPTALEGVGRKAMAAIRERLTAGR